MLLDDLELAEKLEKEKMKPKSERDEKKVEVEPVNFEELVDSLKSVELLYREEEE